MFWMSHLDFFLLVNGIYMAISYAIGTNKSHANVTDVRLANLLQQQIEQHDAHMQQRTQQHQADMQQRTQEHQADMGMLKSHIDMLESHKEMLESIKEMLESIKEMLKVMKEEMVSGRRVEHEQQQQQEG